MNDDQKPPNEWNHARARARETDCSLCGRPNMEPWQVLPQGGGREFIIYRMNEMGHQPFRLQVHGKNGTPVTWHALQDHPEVIECARSQAQAAADFLQKVADGSVECPECGAGPMPKVGTLG